MFEFDIDVDNRAIKNENKKLSVQVSQAENNGLSIDENGYLIATPGQPGESGQGTRNYPYNGITGNPDMPIQVIKCNPTVTRLKLGDPDPENEGKCILCIVNHILGREEVEHDD